MTIMIFFILRMLKEENYSKKQKSLQNLLAGAKLSVWVKNLKRIVDYEFPEYEECAQCHRKYSVCLSDAHVAESP